MRKLAPFVFLLLWIATGCASSYPHRSPEQLAKTVFKVLKHQEPGGLDQVIPTQTDLEMFLSASDMPEEELTAFREEMKQILAEFSQKAQQDFSAASDAASRAGLMWSKARLRDIQSETRQGPDNELAVVEATVDLNGKPYLLRIVDAGKVSSGWVLGMEGFSLTAKE